MTPIYFALAFVAVVSWAPILGRFYGNWSSRRNPISLAICAAVFLLMWLAVAGGWVVSGGVAAEIVTFVSTGVSIIVAICTNLTFHLAKKKFDERE